MHKLLSKVRMSRVVATPLALVLCMGNAFAQNTPAQNQQYINSLPWTNGKNEITGIQVESLFTNINGTFGLYARNGANSDITSLLGLTGPVDMSLGNSINNGLSIISPTYPLFGVGNQNAPYSQINLQEGPNNFGSQFWQVFNPLFAGTFASTVNAVKTTDPAAGTRQDNILNLLVMNTSAHQALTSVLTAVNVAGQANTQPLNTAIFDAAKTSWATACSISGSTVTFGGSTYGTPVAGNEVFETGTYNFFIPGTTISGSGPSWTLSAAPLYAPTGSFPCYTASITGFAASFQDTVELDWFKYYSGSTNHMLIDLWSALGATNNEIGIQFNSSTNQGVGATTITGSCTSCSIAAGTGTSTLTVGGTVTGQFQVGGYILDPSQTVPGYLIITSAISATSYTIAAQTNSTPIAALNNAPLYTSMGNYPTWHDAIYCASGSCKNIFEAGRSTFGITSIISSPSQSAQWDYNNNQAPGGGHYALENVTPQFSPYTGAVQYIHGVLGGTVSPAIDNATYYNALAANSAGAPQWGPGQAFTSGEYVIWLGNLYTAGSSGTSGSTPPTCGSGTCSDDNITWTFVSKALIGAIGTDSSNNILIGLNAATAQFKAPLIMLATASPGASAAGNGAMYALSTYGFVLQGSGSICDLALRNHNGASSACVGDGAGAPFLVQSTSVSTSTATGALQVAGGMGVVGAGYFGGLVSAATLAIPSIPTSAGSGGLYVCVDTTGATYKKASCP